jgi:glycosyltransferase involved in cell wall biosynthesis
MAGTPPLPISIIIPAYGRQDTLLRALRSVVTQDAPPAEIIVVDDGSEPPIDVSGCDTGTIPLTVLRHETNRGAAAARNTGMRSAKSEWISFLDSDDHLMPSSLAKRWELISAQTGEGLTVFACGWVVQDKAGRTLGTRLPREANRPDQFASGCWFSPGSCVVMNRKAVLDTGIWQDEELNRFEDLDWFLSLSLRGAILRTLPLIAVAIERHRSQSPEKVERTARAIMDKWRRTSSDRRLLRRLRAYLDVECAAANHFAGRRFRALAFWARSLLAVPRLSLHLSPAWETDTETPQRFVSGPKTS